MSAPAGPVITTTATAPVRIADVGGWTDTWFASSGAVCHVGVGPGVTVRVQVDDGPRSALPVRLIAPDLGQDYRFDPATVSGHGSEPRRHRLLEHAIAAVLTENHASGRAAPGPIQVTITSAVPPGASLGTSASVVVALLAALEYALGDHAVTEPTDEDRARYAMLAHRVETVAAGRESGVQDHWAAAFGGAQLLRISDYPTTTRTALTIGRRLRATLTQASVTVLIGPHDSSAIHRAVLASLDGAPRQVAARQALEDLSHLAANAATAILHDDVDAWARTLTAATQVQQRLHPGLVGPAHRRLIEHARDLDATGWKVNGAGGDGGSLTAVFPSPQEALGFARRVQAEDPGLRVVTPRPASGVTLRVDSP